MPPDADVRYDKCEGELDKLSAPAEDDTIEFGIRFDEELDSVLNKI